MANEQPNQQQIQELARQQAQFMAKVWSDPALKQRLVDNPKAVLREQGAQIPEATEVRVVENTDQIFYLVLPPKPTDEISDEQLEAVAGGACDSYSRLSTLACATVPSTISTVPTWT